MELVDRVKNLKKSKDKCTVHYGTKMMANGVITDFESGTAARLWIQTSMGEYSIPLATVRRIENG